MFKRSHTLTYIALKWLMYAGWRLFAIMDWVTDILTAKNVSKFSPGWGFLLVVCLIAPYIICAVGMFNTVIREIPRFLQKNRIELEGTDAVVWTYIALAPGWVFLLDAFINARFFMWSVESHYLLAFFTMRRIVLLFVEAILVTLIQIQIMWQDIPGIKGQLLGQSIAISIINIVLNGSWLYARIRGQHRPWNKFIMNTFRGGLSAIPGVDDVRDGVEDLEIFDGIEHFSEVMAVTQAVVESGKACRLKNFTIQRCKVDDEGVRAIVQLLETNTTIVNLNLDHNDVSVSQGRCLV
jgi:hypothetical protein